MELSKYHVRKATLADCSLIRSLASQIWEPTYGGILSPEQLTWMFEWMYAIPSLENQMNSGHTFYIAYEGENPVAYMSIEKRDEYHYHLQKIYILPDKQGGGLGCFLIDKASGLIKKDKEVTLSLNVNRYNTKACYFYQKQGFTIESEGDFHIGHGFYMTDYIMSKKI